MSYFKDGTEKIASHYNKLQDAEYGVFKREETRIYPLRCFNNWVKSCLISRFGKIDSSVIDICSGRGGDLGKFEASLHPSYITMIDISLLSLLEAAERYNHRLKNYSESSRSKDNRRPWGRREQCLPPPLDLVWGDCCVHDLASNSQMIRECGMRFSYAQIQFALHYSWINETRARKLLENVGAVLAPNNCFVATFPDKKTILTRVSRQIEKQGTSQVIGNSLYKIEFSTPIDQTKLEALRRPSFGQSYRFYLESAVQGEEEYLVDMDLLCKIALEYGLELKLIVPFSDFEHMFNDPTSRLSSPECREMFMRYNRPPKRSMINDYNNKKVPGAYPSNNEENVGWNGISLSTMDPELKEVVELYVAVVFQRAPITEYVGGTLAGTIPSPQPLCLGSIMSLYGENAVNEELGRIYDGL